MGGLIMDQNNIKSKPLSLREEAVSIIKRNLSPYEDSIMLSNELIGLIPENKFDFDTFQHLSKISEAEVNPILMGLLFCIADMNWPIASEMVSVLTRFPKSLVPLVKKVLKPSETDEDWKWFIITGLIPKLQVESQAMLIEDLLRIAKQPTAGEKHSEVDEVAKHCAEMILKHMTLFQRRNIKDV